MDDIEERLRSHAQAFDGLLSLIPAKYYYADDTSDQWQRKKQSREQARQAKRAKLDPDSAKTAKDVLDENARKRKRDEKEANDDFSDDDLGTELPMEGLKRGTGKTKKQKQEENANTEPEAAAPVSDETEAKRRLNEEKKAQIKAAQREKKKAKEAAKREKKKGNVGDATSREVCLSNDSSGKQQEPPSKAKKNDVDEQHGHSGDDGSGEKKFSIELNAPRLESSSANSSTPNSPGFDGSNAASGSSSISSIVPPVDTQTDSNLQPTPLKSTPAELKQRLQKRLDELRARRHADGLNGKPARNRQELIEARRQKAEQRKAHKKLLRQKAREEEQRLKDEAMARRFSPGGSGSLLASPRSPVDSIGSNNNNFVFGRVVFADGQQADASLSTVRDAPKKPGPQDPATALKATETKKARLESLDEEKRAEIEAKDMWLNAKKRAHGERVRDDTSLLKKALKRKESAKRKSEREWKERVEGVAKGKEIRQAKREENLRKRREGKGAKGSKKPGSKRPARPGFEGSFKTKVGGKKK